MVSTDFISVSIVVPCYKVEKYLPKCLDSLVSQSLQNIEIICINDGSPDRCLDILNRYKTQYPSKVVVIDKQNEGVWRGRQDAIKIARGEYIGFVDSDDYVSPDFCDKLYATAKHHDADISVCGYFRIDAYTGEQLTEELTEKRLEFDAQTHPELLLQLNGAPWNKLFRASILKDMYDFENPPRIFDDIMMHLLVYPEVHTVCFAPYPLVYYVIRNDSIMTSIDRTKLESAYSGMKEVREHYELLGASKPMFEFLDAAAFLHLGISLMFRASYDRSIRLSKTVKDNTYYLDNNFPLWKSSKAISLTNAIKYKGPFIKIYVARVLYIMHAMPVALAIYKLLIRRLGIDIKW